jgi:acetyl-CoA acyltransferase
MSQAYILAAYRTPGCRARKGKLAQLRPDDLAAAAIGGLVERAGIEASQVEDVVLGCAFPEAEQGLNIGRVAAMKAGFGHRVPGMTLNRMCSSGLQAIAIAADRVMAGHGDAIVAGGVESMSLVPMGGIKFSANPGLVATWPEAYASMGITAELVAERYEIGRDRQDEFALASHAKAARAAGAGRFDDEIVAVDVEHVAVDGERLTRSTETVDADDGIRADTSLEALAKLKPAFKANGTVTAGNSSQVTDGAAAALVVSERFLERTGIEPRARFVSYAVAGVPPEVMGIGPVAAIPAALERARLGLADIDLIELNEAFAAQCLAVIGELGIDTERVNVNGGAIALGHPLGCTGAKLTATLLAELSRRQGARYGMVSMCIGGGMGAAGIFEKV